MCPDSPAAALNNRVMTFPIHHRAALLLVVTLFACAPALDWRDVHADATGLQLQFPCKPAQQQRALPLAGAPVVLTLLVCSADGRTFGLAHADVSDPARVQAALRELAAAATRNIAGTSTRSAPLQMTGATPNEASLRQRLAGRLPDGKPAQMELALFAVGTRVFQASVLGEDLRDEAAEAFIASLRPAR
jgi:hypothetical protein